MAQFLCAGVLGVGGVSRAATITTCRTVPWWVPRAGALFRVRRDWWSGVSPQKCAPKFRIRAPKCAPNCPRILANFSERLRTLKPYFHR